MSAPSAGGRGGFFRLDPTHFRGKPPEIQARAQSLSQTLMSPVRGRVVGSTSTRYVPTAGPNAFTIEAEQRRMRVTGIDSIAGDVVVHYTDADGRRQDAQVSPALASELEQRARALEQLEAVYGRYVDEGQVGSEVETELQGLVDRVRALQVQVMAKIDQELGLSRQLLEP
jgi:hypothetical protein